MRRIIGFAGIVGIVGLVLILGGFQAFAEEDIGLKAFGKTIYPRLKDACASCHGDAGPQVGHAVSNIVNAYTVSKNYVDFSAPAKSLFTRQVRSKHWLKVDPTQKGMEEKEMIEAINAWWVEGEFASNSRYDYISAPVSLPTDLPLMSEKKYAELIWDLGQMDQKLQGCTAKTWIQRAAMLSGSYRVKDIDLMCPNQAVSGKGIFFFVSDQFAAYENIFGSLEFKVVPGQPLHLNTEPMILIQRDASDTLKIVFKEFHAQ